MNDEKVTKKTALDVLREYRAGEQSNGIITPDDVRAAFGSRVALCLGEYLARLRDRLRARL